MQPNPETAAALELALLPVLQDNYVVLLRRAGVSRVPAGRPR